MLRRTREEVPHAVEVAGRARSSEREDGLVEVRAQVWAETESQKGILIGKGGRDDPRDRHRGPQASSSASSAPSVFLDLQVRVRERWRRDEGLLDRLGIE